MLDMARERGVKAAFPNWKGTDAAAIATLERMTDAEYARLCGCDNPGEDGVCRGHENSLQETVA